MGSFAWLAIDVAVIRESDGISTRMTSCGLSIWLGVLKASGMIGRQDSKNEHTKREITETFKSTKGFHYFPGATIIKYHILSGLKKLKFMSPISETRSIKPWF